MLPPKCQIVRKTAALCNEIWPQQHFMYFVILILRLNFDEEFCVQIQIHCDSSLILLSIVKKIISFQLLIVYSHVSSSLKDILVNS